MVACLFGENEGPGWVWIVDTIGHGWAWVYAWCDNTGWDCQSGGEWAHGFGSATEAIKACPHITEAQSHLLRFQAQGDAPYGMTNSGQE